MRRQQQRAVIPMLALAVAALGAGGERAMAQEQLAFAGRGPRFLIASPSSAAARPVDAGRVPLLRQQLSLDLSDATLVDALDAITRQTGLAFVYSRDILPPDVRVNLRAERITLAAAITEILLDAKVDVLLSSKRQAALVRRAEVRVVEPPGEVRGRVTDAKTGAGVAGAAVRLEGAGLGAMAGDGGQYRIVDVPPGSYALTVRRLGYAQQRRAVTIASGDTITIDVALEPVATMLDQVVTTVTGEHRRLELGHVVGRINADSLVREAPVTSISELLNARIPGLQVFTGQGTVGGDVAIRIRGATTALLTQEPIVIVDGIRYTSDRKAPQGPAFSSHEATSRLNDLNPNDIESVEVVKGPSAATLYGTDAVNGVIVITTKRGHTGPTRWRAYSRLGRTEIPVARFPDGVRGWSASVANCTLALLAQNSCTQDSITVIPNPLNDPEMTIFGNKPRWEYGANVSGGGEKVRYFASGDFEDATGPVQMPTALVKKLEALRGVSTLPEEQRNPNQLTKMNLRTNVGANLTDRADLQFNAGYTQNTTHAIRNALGPYTNGAFQGTPSAPYGTSYSPDRIFSLVSAEEVNRLTGEVRLDVRPLDWLSMWALAGLDLGMTTRHSLVRPGEGPPGTTRGVANDERRRDVQSSADVGVRASFELGRITSRTAAGAQYLRTLYDGMLSTGIGLPPGGETVADASTVTASSGYSETVTLGAYLEQTLGLDQRLFVTGALRADGASAFGRDYKAAIYPKVSVSWLISEESRFPHWSWLEELRVRYAYGASGRQPQLYMALPSYSRGTAFVDGKDQQTIDYYGLGNPDLRPERTREHEFGFDAAMLHGRLRMEGTWYFRTTVDGIQSTQLPPGYGFLYVNVGEVRDRGFEGQLWLRPVESRTLTWDVSLQHSSNTNRLVDIGDAPSIYSIDGGLVEGYPIGARFMVPLLGYDDANGNGIIERSEVVMGDRSVYAGRSDPPQTQTLSTTLGLLAQRLRLSALFDRRAGYTQYDGLGHVRCATGYCRAVVDPATPAAIQAQAAALGLAPDAASGGSAARYTFMDKGDFIRLREVAVVWDLPGATVRAMRLRQATLGLSVRNLAMWSSFRGVDVESVVGAGELSRGDSGRPGGIPQARSWALRFDIGF